MSRNKSNTKAGWKRRDRQYRDDVRARRQAKARNRTLDAERKAEAAEHGNRRQRRSRAA